MILKLMSMSLVISHVQHLKVVICVAVLFLRHLFRIWQQMVLIYQHPWCREASILYMLHTDVGKVRIDTPLQEKRIGAVIRGSGPRDIKEMKWESFDGHLQKLTIEKGANIIHERITTVDIKDGLPQIKTRKGDFQTYDLLTVAVGVKFVCCQII